MIALYTFVAANAAIDAASFCRRHELSREEVVSVLQTQSSGSVDGMPYEALTITVVLDCAAARLRHIEEAEREDVAPAYREDDAPAPEAEPLGWDSMADIPY